MSVGFARSERVRHRLLTGCGGVAIVAGLLVLFGWFADITILKSVMPGRTAMKANSAVLFVLAGLSMWAAGNQMRGAGLALALLVVFVVLLTAAQYAFFIDLGVDQLLFRELPATPANPSPGRMAPSTVIVFGLIGSTLALHHANRSFLARQILASFALFISSLCCLSYLFGANSSHAITPFSSVAMHTAILFLILSAGLMAASADRAWVGLLADGGVGGALIRRVFPVAVVIPVLIGGLRLAGQRAGWYGTEFGAALFAISNITLFTVVLFWAASQVRRSDGNHMQAEEQLRRSERRYRALIQATPQVVWTSRDSESGAMVWWMELTGQFASEASGWGFLDAVHPDDRERVRETWAAAMNTRMIYDTEYRIRIRSGEYRHFAVQGVALCDPDGILEEWVGTLADIHNRKMAEEQLRELNATLERRVAERTEALAANEALLSQFVTHAPAAIAMFDTEMRYLRISDRWQKDYHLQEQDIIGKSHYEVFPDIPERWKEAHQRVLRGTVEACAEDPFPRASGELDWLQWEARPWRKSGGEIGGLIFFTQVITARKQVEEALQENQARLEMALAASHMGVWEWDIRSGSIYWSPECQTILAGASFSGTRKSFAEVIHPHDVGRVWAAVETSLATRQPYAAEFRIVTSAGKTKWLSNVGRATYDSAGKALRMVGLVQDISERRRAEEALREQEERFRSAFDHAPIGMALVAPDGRWLQVNQSLCELVGRSAGELLSQNFQAFTHPADLDTDLSLVRQVLDGAIKTYQLEKRYFHKQGNVVQTLLTVSLVRDNDSQPLYLLAQIQDITRRKRAEQALRDSEERFRLLVEGVKDYAIYMLDPDGNVVSWNLGAKRITGYDTEEVVGRHF
ncbi:PAS domain S-box protein, partial [Zavarzinella formosa]|uniref:PAS domain S-box protein n=1 Tax=Zavarzinella formosa TaxID=360055 RepID=UPI00187DD5DB